jgi:hypothetical protein
MSDYLLRDIIDKLEQIRVLLNAPSEAVSVSLSLSEVQVQELTRVIQAELLRQAKRSPRTALKLRSPPP